MFVARRDWTVERNSRRYDVAVEDEYFLGHRVVRVNGEVAYEGRTVLSDHTGAYQFDLGGSPAFLRVRTNGFTYSYELIIDGRSFETGRPLELEGHDLRPRSSPGLTILSGVFFVGLLLVGVFIGGERIISDAALAVAGVDGEGIISEKRVEHHRNGDSYVLAYRSVTPPATFVGRIYVAESEYRSANVGDPVRIAHFRSDPTINGRRPSLGDVAADLLLAGSLSPSPVGIGPRDRRRRPRAPRRRADTRSRDRDDRKRRRGQDAPWPLYERHGLADRIPFPGRRRGASGADPVRRTGKPRSRWPIGSPVRVRLDPEHPGDSRFVG